MIFVLALLLQDEWTFQAEARSAGLVDAGTRTRSLELEGLSKGGSGKGTYFTYEDVGLRGVRAVPELALSARKWDHRVDVSFFRYGARESATLDETIEYDGDLHTAGERVQASCRMAVLDAGYAYRIVDDPLDVWIGARAIYFSWELELQTLAPGPTPPSDTESNEIVSGIYLPTLSAEARYLATPDVVLHGGLSYALGSTFRRGVQGPQNSNGWLRARAGATLLLGQWSLDVSFEYLSIDALSLEHSDEVDVLNYQAFGLSAGLAFRF